MASVIAEYASVAEAFQQPALSLLHQKNAAAIVAVLRACFEGESNIQIELLYRRVDVMLEELRVAGASNVPSGSGREVCQELKGKWLGTDVDDHGRQVFVLTTASQTALNFVKEMESERPMIAGHRLADLIRAAQALNIQVNPNKEARMALLRKQIDDLSAEWQRLSDGGELHPVSQATMVEGYANLFDLYKGVLADLRRIGEWFRGRPAKMIKEYRDADRTAGEVALSFIDQVDTFMEQTPEGQSLVGVQELLRREDRETQLQDAREALAEHPVGAALLSPTEKSHLVALVDSLTFEVSAALTSRSRAAGLVRDYIVTTDINLDRQLAQVLRHIDAMTPAWLEQTTRRTKTDFDLLPADLTISHLADRFYDPSDTSPPLPLENPEDSESPDLADFANAVKWGGPQYDDLQQALNEAAGRQTVNELFQRLPNHLRRPADLFGLLQLAVAIETTTVSTEQSDVIITIDPSGVNRSFISPRVYIFDHEVQS